ncbi:MAG: NAD-dependent protein deacylase [Eubacteriales bacterium]
MEDTILRALRDTLAQANNIVFFGGAGVSTESGIPDFRSANGIYQNRTARIPPEEILSHSFFLSHPAEFFDFYRQHLLYPDARPNRAHFALAKLEAQGRLTAVITQNVDGLHQAAGSKQVFELHGSVHRNYCMQCGRFFPLSFVLSADGIPRCPDCGGIVKPDVVLYEEPLDEDCLSAALNAVMAADTLLIGGTSLSVYPAAGLVRYFHGRSLVILNRTPTPYDRRASLVIPLPVGQALGEAVDIPAPAAL